MINMGRPERHTFETPPERRPSWLLLLSVSAHLGVDATPCPPTVQPRAPGYVEFVLSPPASPLWRPASPPPARSSSAVPPWVATDLSSRLASGMSHIGTPIWLLVACDLLHLHVGTRSLSAFVLAVGGQRLLLLRFRIQEQIRRLLVASFLCRSHIPRLLLCLWRVGPGRILENVLLFDLGRLRTLGFSCCFVLARGLLLDFLGSRLLCVSRKLHLGVLRGRRSLRTQC